VDGGEVLQIWKVAANILNKQSRTADKGPSSLAVGWGANNSSPSKNQRITKRYTGSRTDQTKEDGMGGVCSAHGEDAKYVQMLVGKPEGMKRLKRPRRR
jgi:hypothetical protein